MIATNRRNKISSVGKFAINADPEQDFVPKVKGVLKEDGSIFPPPIEEMSPLLSFETVENEMIAGISEKSKLIKR